MSRILRARTKRSTRKGERLDELQREFEAYRSDVPEPYSRRFPLELKKKVLAAIESEIPLRAILKACRITTGQVRLWQENIGTVRSRVTQTPVPAQILDVVEKPDNDLVSADECIEIRIGRWQVRLRLEQADSCRR